MALRQVKPYVSLKPNQGSTFPVTVYHSVREPADLHIQTVVNCEGWQATVEPALLPAQPPGTAETVQVTLRPPGGVPLGSGCPVDIIAWTDTGELAGSQRILDLPPMQASPDSHPFSAAELWLDPPNPEFDQESRLCATVYNRADTELTATVAFLRGERLSTAPATTQFDEQPVNVPARGLGQVCSEPWVWDGDRSFQALVFQDGYLPQTMTRNVGTVQNNDQGSPAPYLLEIRNPLNETATLSLTAQLVGLPGWQVQVPQNVTLGAGEAAEVQLLFTQTAIAAADTMPGDAGRVEVWASTPDSQTVGGAWLQVWEREQEGGQSLYLPAVSSSD